MRDIAPAMMRPRPPLNVVKLSEHGGQFVLTIICPCGHTRTASPSTLARFAGWDALLADVVKRMRCSKCGEHKCRMTVRAGNEARRLTGFAMDQHRLSGQPQGRIIRRLRQPAGMHDATKENTAAPG